jgi:hypothetical protein
MITKYIPPKTRVYPYLAIWTFDKAISEDTIIDVNDIVLISQVYKNDVKCSYVSYVNGGKESFITASEKEYAPLPSGYKIELIQ